MWLMKLHAFNKQLKTTEEKSNFIFMEQRNTHVSEKKRRNGTYIVNSWDEQQCCWGYVKHNNESQKNQHPWSEEALVRDKSVKNKSIDVQSLKAVNGPTCHYTISLWL